MTDDLKSFLELNLPKVKAGKDPKFIVGVVSGVASRFAPVFGFVHLCGAPD
jgi:hypothetical protein